MTLSIAEIALNTRIFKFHSRPHTNNNNKEAK